MSMIAGTEFDRPFSTTPDGGRTYKEVSQELKKHGISRTTNAVTIAFARAMEKLVNPISDFYEINNSTIRSAGGTDHISKDYRFHAAILDVISDDIKSKK